MVMLDELRVAVLGAVGLAMGCAPHEQEQEQAEPVVEVAPPEPGEVNRESLISARPDPGEQATVFHEAQACVREFPRGGELDLGDVDETDIATRCRCDTSKLISRAAAECLARQDGISKVASTTLWVNVEPVRWVAWIVRGAEQRDGTTTTQRRCSYDARTGALEKCSTTAVTSDLAQRVEKPGRPPQRRNGG